MINRKDLLALEFYKSTHFSGSDGDMRYRVFADKEEKTIVSYSATIWPGPFCYEATADELKETSTFPASEEGMCMLVDWLNSRSPEFQTKGDLF